MWQRLVRPFVFPAHLTNQPRPDVEFEGLEKYWLETREGPVEYWFIAAKNSHPRPCPLLVFAHGNAEVIDLWARALTRYTSIGAHVALIEYRGYGRSEGRPSQDAIVDDFSAVLATLSKRPDVDPQRVVYHGRSLGGGVVCALAQRKAPRAMVLQSTFSSMKAMFRKVGVPAWLAPDPFDNLATVSKLSCPLVIIHGADDDLIPVSQAKELAKAATNATLHVLSSVDHNTDLSTDARFWKPIEALFTNL